MQTQLTLDSSLREEVPQQEKSKVASSIAKPEVLGPQERPKLKQRLAELTREVSELGPSILLSATYDGERRVAVLKFYEPKENRFYLWSDKSGHKPHCFSKTPPAELQYLKKERSNILDIVPVTKRDLISDKEITVSKIITSDPLAIGGQENSLRNTIAAWEADIKYYENFLYDSLLYVGAFYQINGGKLQPVPYETPVEVQDSLKRTLASSKPDIARQIESWAALLNQPLPYLKRAALDIEVLSPENRIPNPDEAAYPVVAASIVSEGKQKLYILHRENTEIGRDELPKEAEVHFYKGETDLLIQLFRDMLEYPFIATFNGDDFDLNYLYHRALRPEISLTREEVPIVMGNNFAGLKYGVHIDLYKTFNNRSLQIYAFGNKYADHTLNGVAEGLLNESKVAFDGLIGDLPIYELAKYNLQDTLLTYKLVSIYNDVLMKLLVVIARVGKMPIDDLSRIGVSNWIRSMLYFEHRRQNALIPRPEELKEKGGAKSEAVIKGKKYKGGLVIEPVSGVHFNVSVLDFASLYPSIIKVHNISYETVNCPHPECRSNVIPEVGTWTCKVRRGIESLVVGSLRDLRVDYYKQLTRSKTLGKDEKELYKVVSQGLKVILNACFTGDTDILTTEGLMNVKDVRVGDKVVNVNPETMMPEIDEVVETQAFDYDGLLYNFKNGRQVDLKVTNNHRMLIRRGKNPVTFLSAEDVCSWSNVAIPRINSPAISQDESTISIAAYRSQDKFVISLPIAVSGHHVNSEFSDLWQYLSSLGFYDQQSQSFLCDNLMRPQIDRIRSLGGEVSLSSSHIKYSFEFKGTDFAELCGWLISKGSFAGTDPESSEKRNYNGFDCTIEIAQPADCGNSRGGLVRKEITALLKRMQLSFEEFANGFRIANPALRCFCLDQIRKEEKQRQIPSLFLAASIAVKRRLVLALVEADGSTSDPRYLTASETLANQLCSLLAQLGYRPRKSVDHHEGRIFTVVWNNSSVGLTKAAAAKLKWISREKYQGKVYCVTTRKNHTVFAGRNGIFVPVGQSYGVLGFESFPLYCLPAAEAIATLGRYSITKTIEKCKELGIEVVYSDTDSLFLKAPSEQQILDVSAWTQKELGIELDVDKVYRYVAMSNRKKNYFGVLQDGTADLKGLTGKKSQTPQFIKDSFYEILDILTHVKTKDDFEIAREEIMKRLKSDYQRLKQKEIPMEDLAFNVMIGKEISGYKDNIPQHVRAAQLLQKSGKEIRAGDIISFVKTTTGDGAKPATITRKDEVDVEKYVEYMRSTFDQILGSLEYDFDEILGATKLEDFLL